MLFSSLAFFLFTACGEKSTDTADTTDVTDTDTTDTDTTDTDTTDTDTDTTDTDTTDPVEEGGEAFCSLFEETCGDWDGTDCVTWFNGSPMGTEGDFAGATQACYEYHLDVAVSSGDTVHCEHAAGAAPCVDEVTAADAFCELFVGTCGDWAGNVDCVTWFNDAPMGTEGDTSGATQACYEYHLDVATTSDPEVHCEHAAGADPCVD